MKKIALFLALLLALSLLAGCGKQHVHDWEDATCTEPETCSICGETRGEPLGHRWRRGSCTEPETCSRCGKTRGEPGEHELASPADYWSAGVCSRCGQEIEPKLTPDFVLYGLDRCFIEQGRTYDYRTICYGNENAYTVGHARVTSYDIIDGNDDLPRKEGYEWRTVRFEVVFDDSNANEYGMSVGISSENYYNIREHDDTAYSDDEYSYFQLTYKGQTYECCEASESGFGDWNNDSCTWTGTYSFRVPVGFDGMVVGLRNRGVPWPDGAYCFDLDNSDTLYFRLS